MPQNPQQSPQQLGYAKIPTEGSARSIYGKVSRRGNLILVIESTEQLASLRQRPPSGYITPRQARALPGATPTTYRSERVEGRAGPTATLPEAPSLREQRMRLLHGPFPPLPPTPPEAPLLTYRPSIAERREYATLVLPAEILDALRDYYVRRGLGSVTYAEAVNAASYAIFTAKLSAIPSGRATIGRFVAPPVGSPKWVLEQLATLEVPSRGIRAESFAPGAFPQRWSPSNLPGQFPVTYFTVVAVLFFVHAGVHISREYFANLMQRNGWHPCGTAGVFTTLYPSLAEAEAAEPTISVRSGMYVPETSEVIYCPPPKSFPVPPPTPKARPLTPTPPPPLERRRVSTPAVPARYRRLG